MRDDLKPTMKPKEIRGPYSENERDTIRIKKKRAIEKAQEELQTAVMVKITRTGGKYGETFTLEYEDGTAYMIDEFTAEGITDITKSYLKTRLP